MMQQGYKGLNWAQHSEGTPILDVMIDVMRGKAGTDVKFLGSMVRYLTFPATFMTSSLTIGFMSRKLKSDQLTTLLEGLHAYLHSMPSGVKVHEEDARAKLVISLDVLPKQVDEDISSGKWLVEYLK
jgi:origin recognition complex subunit 3